MEDKNNIFQNNGQKEEEEDKDKDLVSKRLLGNLFYLVISIT